MTDAKPLLGEFEERFAEAGGRRVRYLVGGAGRPLVLVHGWGGSASNWAVLAPDLARSRRVIVPELPGHGGSDRVPRGSTLAPYADSVAAVVEQEDAAPAPVVGHSLGGVVSLRLALQLRSPVRAPLREVSPEVGSGAPRVARGGPARRRPDPQALHEAADLLGQHLISHPAPAGRAGRR